MGRKEKILFILIQLFFIATICNYNDIVSGIITGAMMLGCILYTGLRNMINLINERKYILWMIFFFAWIFFSIFLSKDTYEGFRALDPRLPLFYFPLTIGLIKISKEFKERLLLGFAVITTVFCSVCLIWSINNFIKSGNVDYLYSDAITALADQQSAYISLLVNLSIYIYTRLFFFNSYPYRLVFIPAIVFLFIISYMLAGRTMMIVLYISTITFVFIYIFRRKKYLEIAALLISLTIVCLAVFTFFPKTINRFKDFVYTEYDYKHEGSESNYSKETTPDQWNGTNFRLAAWRCGWELFKQYPFTGVHLGDKRSKLIEKYKEKDFQFAIRTNKNVHNNYLDILFGTGLAGLFLFLTGWIILPLRRALLFKDYLSVLILLTFAIAMITEVWFDRSLGGMLFGFFIPFLLTDKTRAEDY